MTYEELIGKVQRRIKRIYKDAEQDVLQAVSDYLDTFLPKEEEDTKTAEKSLLLMALKVKGIRDIARSIYKLNKDAKDEINNAVPQAFADTMNQESFEIEQEMGEDIGLFPVSPDDIEEWIEEDPEMYEEGELNERKDTKWNTQIIRNAIIAGVLIGVKKLPQYVTGNVMKRNRDSMLSNAWDTISGAGEAGREQAMLNTQKKGVEIEKEWVATLDFKTRDAHRELDGQRVPVDKPFEVDGEEIMFPRDPSAPAYLRCNCRCAMRRVRHDWSMGERRENIRHYNEDGTWYKPIVPGMTYSQWYDMKVQELGEVEIQRQIKEMKREQNRKYYRKRKKRQKEGA